MTRWDDTWPATRFEAHYGDRVVRCFPDRPASVNALLLDAVQRNPDGDAFVCAGNRITFRGLLDLSSRVAAGMAARGIAAGDRVALLLGNRNEFVVALFAVARLGAIAVPLSIREQTPGLAYMLNDCAAALVVHESDLGDRLPPAAEVPSLRVRISVSVGDTTVGDTQPRLTRKKPWTVRNEMSPSMINASSTEPMNL